MRYSRLRVTGSFVIRLLLAMSAFRGALAIAILGSCPMCRPAAHGTPDFYSSGPGISHVCPAIEDMKDLRCVLLEDYLRRPSFAMSALYRAGSFRLK
jgi:hypothetical protein